MDRSMVGMLVMLLSISRLCVVYAIDDKCAACNVVAEEIERGLSKEKPRNHLDMRHRLDSKGQRTGKVIDYRYVYLQSSLSASQKKQRAEQQPRTVLYKEETKVSELRVVELLDGLCDKMQDYTLQKMESGGYKWVLVHNFDNLTNKQEAKAHAKDISSYCGRLLENTEDELAELIKKEAVKVGDVSKVLCQDLSRHCAQSSDNDQDLGSDDESDAEL